MRVSITNLKKRPALFYDMDAHVLRMSYPSGKVEILGHHRTDWTNSILNHRDLATLNKNEKERFVLLSWF